MPSKQSEAVRPRWQACWLALAQPDAGGPDDESWGDLTAEPREVDYPEITAAGHWSPGLACPPPGEPGRYR